MSLRVDQIVPEGTCSQVLRSTSVDSYRLRASKFSVLKLIEIVILLVYYTIPFGLFWLRITDEGSIPEMRKWSILVIKSDLKWCIHLNRSPLLYLKIKLAIWLTFNFYRGGGNISTLKIDTLLSCWNCAFMTHKGSHTKLNIWTIKCSLSLFNSMDNLHGTTFRQGITEGSIFNM